MVSSAGSLPALALGRKPTFEEVAATPDAMAAAPGAVALIKVRRRMCGWPRSTLHAAARQNLAIGRRQIGRTIHGAFADEFEDALHVVAGGPGFAQEVRWMNSMLAQEGAIAAAAIHQVGRHFAAQLDARLFDDARQ